MVSLPHFHVQELNPVWIAKSGSGARGVQPSRISTKTSADKTKTTKKTV